MKKLFLACFAAIAMFVVRAATETVNGIEWHYTVNDGKAEIYNSWETAAIPSSTKGAVTIPSALGGYPVTSIGSFAFYGCSGLTSVTIPNSVTSIGDYALDGCCSITKVVIPEGVERIGNRALSGMWDLQSVVLPESLKYISDGAFREDGLLDNVIIPDAVEKICDGAFEDCSYLQNITVGKGVTSIGNRTFAGCTQLQKISFEEGLREIGHSAFSNCWRMMSVSLPLTISNVCPSAFMNCSSLVGVRLPTHSGTLSEWFAPVVGQIRYITIPVGETDIVDDMFAGCASIRNVIFEKSNHSNNKTNFYIGCRAFSRCSSLEDIELPENLVGLGSSAFSECKVLKAIVLPANVTYLGESTFSGCCNLSSVTLSSSLTSLPDYVFYGCDSLDSFTVPASVTYLGARFASGSNKWSGPSAIYFLGNAPSYSSFAYEGTRDDLTSYVVLGTRGWDGRISSRDIPQQWPVDNTYSRLIKTWSPNPFDVTFDANGGVFENDGSSSYACQQVSYTDYAIPPYNPKRTQCIFDGWWTEPYGGAQISSSTLVTLTKAHTLYAHWIVGGNVRVRFNANGGIVSPEWKNYDTGVPFGELPIPTREYKEFDGWWTEVTGGERITAASEVPAADVELFAHWNPAQYKIVFHSENGNDSTKEQVFKYGDTVTLYKNRWSCGSAVFGGWATEKGGPAKYADEKTLTEISDIRNGEIHLYAVWIGDSYSVRFDSNGGYGVMPNQKMVVGVSYYLDTNCYERAGWTFKGWSLTPEGPVKYKDGVKIYGGLSSTDGATIVLYAVWEGERTYAVTFNGNGGQCSETVRYVTDGDAVGELPVPTRNGYIFQGWYTARTGGVKVTPQTKITKGVTYYAYWVRGVTSYTVTFNPTGGEVAPSNRVLKSGEKIGALPVPQRLKYKFLGWYTSEDGGTKISSTTKVTEDVMYYAQWERVSFSSVIRFDSNGGLCGVTNRFVFSGSKVGAVPKAVRVGYSFAGWFTDPESGNEISKDTTVIDDVTFYAHWESEDLDAVEYELGKLYGTNESGAEYVEWKDMLKYAYLSKTPMVFIIGWEKCHSCKWVHQTFLDSGKWDLPCLLYYDYYYNRNSSTVEEYDLFRNSERDGSHFPSVGLYWNLGDGRVVKKIISLYDGSYGKLVCYPKNDQIDKDGISNLIKDAISSSNSSTAGDDIGEFIQEWKLPQVEDVGMEVDGLNVKSDGTVEITVHVYANDIDLQKVEVSGLPTGVKYDSKTMTIQGNVAKPGVYNIEVKATVDSPSGKYSVIKDFAINVPNLVDDMIRVDDEYGFYIPGVSYVETIDDAVGCTVTGLPSGMKWTAKDIVDSKTKEVTVPANSVYGVPTKPGKYTVYFTKTVDKVKHTATASFYVDDFPVVYVDTFGYGTGSVTEEIAAAANKKVTLKATADTKDDEYEGTVKSVFAGWYYDYYDDDYGYPLETSVDYRTPSLPYVMTKEPFQIIYAKFVPVQEDFNIGLKIVKRYKSDQIGRIVIIGDQFEVTSNPSDVNLVLDENVFFAFDIKSHSLPKVAVSGLPAGMKFTAKALTVKATKTEDAYDVPANSIYGTPTKPGIYTVTVKLTNATVKKAIEKKFTIEVPNFTAANGYFADELKNNIGQKYALSAGVSNIDDFLPSLTLGSPMAKLAVSGLPTGLKYDAKTGKITGVATKAGNYTVTLTVTEGREKYVSTVTIAVEALPEWATGAFAGMVGVYEGDKFFACGSLSMTVAADGKISAKVLLKGKTYSFSSPSYVSVEDGAYLVQLETKAGDVLELAISEQEVLSVRGEGAFLCSADNKEYCAFVWRNEHGAKNRLGSNSKAAGAIGAIAKGGTVYLSCIEDEGRFERAESSKKYDLKLSVNAKSGVVTYSGNVDGIRVSGSEFLKFYRVEDNYYYIIADLVVYDKKTDTVLYFAFGWDVEVDENVQYVVSEDFYLNYRTIKIEDKTERDMVQLWEGGPYWATTNIGAEKPEDYGYYFWWGDTVGYKRENNKWVASDGWSNSNFSFSESNTPTDGKSISTLKSEGWITSDGVLAPEHDAATVHWGNGWRMPTKDELSALNNYCDWTSTTQNGVKGYLIKGRGAYASKSIFLPAAGYGYGTSLYNSGSHGIYWSSVPNSFYDNGAWGLDFNSSDRSTHSYDRYNGQSVRAVLGFTK